MSCDLLRTFTRLSGPWAYCATFSGPDRVLDDKAAFAVLGTKQISCLLSLTTEVVSPTLVTTLQSFDRSLDWEENLSSLNIGPDYLFDLLTITRLHSTHCSKT